MVEFFDIDNLNQGAYRVGVLNQQIINMLNISRPKADIVFSKDKIEYTVKHKHKYDNDEEYKKLVECTPNIIMSPDYIGFHPSGQSIEFIKIMSKIMVIAVRYKPYGPLWVKTVFPITQDKFNLYQSSNTLIKFEISVDK